MGHLPLTLRHVHQSLTDHSHGDVNPGDDHAHPDTGSVLWWENERVQPVSQEMVDEQRGRP